jgi:mRNA-degrading endonuclease YafQ of YafQ-DinJ toxin-antitoxin module
MDSEFEVYEGKKFSDLLKDIVKNHKNKQSQIKALIEQLAEMVSEPGDAVMLVPLIKGYIDSDIKNDEALLKLAQVVQKSAAPAASDGAGFSDKDLELLFNDIQKSTTPLEGKDIKELPSIDQ